MIKYAVGDLIKAFMKLFFLFAIGGAVYYCIELLFRGYSHVSMFVLGGICFVICGSLNEIFDKNINLIAQMFLSAVIITTLELIFGYILNLKLHLNIWDYSDRPGDFMGQICPLFSFFWFFLGGAAIVADDYLRYWLYGEDKPVYVLFTKHNQKN